MFSLGYLCIDLCLVNFHLCSCHLLSYGPSRCRQGLKMSGSVRYLFGLMVQSWPSRLPGCGCEPLTRKVGRQVLYHQVQEMSPQIQTILGPFLHMLSLLYLSPSKYIYLKNLHELAVILRVV